MLSLIRDLFSSVLFNDAASPLKAHLTEGATASKVLVVTGSNASGKSFAVRVLATWLQSGDTRAEPLQVSMKYRTAAGMHRAFMYGPFGDAEDSTGSVSLTAVKGGLRTAKGRESPCWLMLDEPDTGLSEDFGHAMGAFIAQSVNEGLGEKCEGLVVVTHSRELVCGLRETLSLEPHFAHIDEKPLAIDNWLASTPRRSVEELLALSEKALMTHRGIQKVLDGLDKKPRRGAR